MNGRINKSIYIRLKRSANCDKSETEMLISVRDGGTMILNIRITLVKVLDNRVTCCFVYQFVLNFRNRRRA